MMEELGVIQGLWTRRREIAYRMLNAALLKCLVHLYRWHGLKGAFIIREDIIAYDHRGVLLAFDPLAKAVAGNIDVSGSYEDHTIKRLLSVCSDEDVFYDVGAHEGIYSLVVKRHVPGARIIAIEPLADRLRTNLGLNQASDVCVIEAALGDGLGEVVITTDRRASNYVSRRGRRLVRVETIDHLVATGFAPPTILKMDIEGYELFALLGAQQTITVHRPLILLEMNASLLRFHASADPIVQLLTRHGYTLYAQTDSHLVELHAVVGMPISVEDNFWAIPEGHVLADALKCG